MNEKLTHPCCSIYQHFIHWYGWIIFHYMYVSYLFIHSHLDRHLGYFYHLAIWNSDAINMLVQAFVWAPVLNSYIPRSRIAGHMVILFNFLRNCQTLSHSSWPFYDLISNVQGFSFSHPCQPWQFSDYFPQIFATLVDVECYLTMVLFCID